MDSSRLRPIQINKKVEKTEKIDKMEKIEKIEKIELIEKVEKIEKIEKVEKVEKTPPPPVNTYVIGEKCYARWNDARKFPGAVLSILENGKNPTI